MIHETGAWAIYYSDGNDIVTRIFSIHSGIDSDRAELDARRAAEEWEKVVYVRYGESVGEAIERTRQERLASV